MSGDEDRTETDSSRDGGVRALIRGLSILRHVNSEGEAKPGEIAAALGIPRPTVYRLLQTLEEEGYIALSASNSRVRVTRLASSLGDGYATTSRLCQATGPLFAEYAPKIVWPCDLTIYENAAMVIQETTHGRSPLSIDRGMIGYRLPMLRSSAGRAYLSFCPQIEREIILQHISRLNDAEDSAFLEPVWLQSVLAETRANGYGSRDSIEFRPQTASLAVPVMVSGCVAACVSIIWIRSALTLNEATSRYLPTLQELAARIAGSATHS
ncbi:MAG: DNA-binding transcriptional regulator [Mesorhizobium sp.]|uniref:DNA-binding transcriptional regulator n=1 Tax=Mesorhizobium sp. TaxID=1871066 RepID=UPI000FE609DC|nr:DNA-binding transcriptional regulator [Mesorhizobium sp.]RWI57050.1 MAG: DNA-binding transcriptional regulator [Mesorhizobium sp.]